LQDDEPLAAQRLQRLPDRGDADAELQGEPFQPQALAGPDAAVEDQLADAGGGLVAQLEARAERPPGSGGGCGQGHVVELPSGPSRGPTPRSSRALTPWFPPRDPFSRGRASVQAMTPSAISGTPKAANPAAPYSMTRPGSLFPPVRLDGSAVAGRGPWSEGDADEDRLVDQLDAERVADASAHLAGERQEVGGLGAARVGEGEGVLGGDARRADGVALSEAGAVDQPGGGRLDPAPVLRVARERDVRAEPLGDAALQLGELARVENGVGEERPGAAGVGVGRVEDHALAAPQVEDRVARLLQRHPVARPDAELLRQLR